jgi:hypothetical protein
LHREVLALEQLQRGQHAGRADQAVLGVQVMAAQQERRELLGGGDRARHAPGVDLPPLDLVEHRDVDVRAGSALAARKSPRRTTPRAPGARARGSTSRAARP